MAKHDDRLRQLLAENEQLKLRLREAEEVLNAIRSGEVDALVVSGNSGDQVYTLAGADQAYRILFETMNEGAAILGTDGTVFFCNTKLASILRTPMETILGNSILRFVRAEESTSFEALLKRGLKEPMKTEFPLRSHNGTMVPCSISMGPLSVENSSYVCSVVTDITERKKLETEREHLIGQLEAKNTELERFLYSVSHDLRSPLITIKAFSGFVKDAIANGAFDGLQLDLARIDKAADKMRELLDEILEISRIGRLSNPSCESPAEDLITGAMELLAGSIRERGVVVQIAPHMPSIYGDGPRILEVFQNLIENAIKFMGDNESPRIEIGSRSDGDETVYYVRDNGIGIEPRYQDQIFGLFDKLDPSREGTGIGLSLVKRVIEAHGGRIWVESEGDGQGSAFCFTLPRAPHTRDEAAEKRT